MKHRNHTPNHRHQARRCSALAGLRVLGAAVVLSACVVPAGAQNSDLYNTDFLPKEVREQLERSRSGNAEANEAARQRNEDVLQQVLGDSSAPAPAPDRVSDADRAMQLLDVLQQTLDRKQEQDRLEQARSAPEPAYPPPAQYRAPPQPYPSAPASAPQPAYRPSQPAAPAPAPSGYAAPQAPAAAPAPTCPPGTTRDAAMAGLNLPSCCDANGQCF